MAYRVSFDVSDDPIDLDSGENTFPRRLINSTVGVSMTNQSLRLAYFTARRTESIGQVRLGSGTAAVGATLVRIGIYEAASNGNLTLVASTANDTTLLSAPSTLYTKALSASFTKTRGKRYAVGLLVVGTTTAPSVFGINGLTAEFGEPPRVTGLFAGQSDLPNSISGGSVANGGGLFYAALVP